jgi:hypothetical protein
MIVAVPPVQAANMSVELLNPAATLESDNGTTVTYTVNQDMDSNSIVFQWNFGNGIDTNWNTNIGLVTLAEDGGAKIALDSSDFTYTKADTPVKLRQMELNLKSTALEPGKDYTVTLGAAIAANNGTDSLGKDYVWKFSTASAGVVEITAFDSIADVNAGTAGAASYADAAAVQAVLPDSVTANAGAVTVPVTAWEDTDLYDPAAAGSYTFTAVLGTIPDGYANTGGSTATAEVIVEAASTADITPPEIILTGNSEINLSVGDPFIEPGYTAIDDVDGDITDNVVVGGDTVDTDTAGTYIITYNVSDAAGNEATEATRTVTVSEKVSTPYTAQQGIGAFQLMLTSVPATDIEVKEATDTYYENVIKTLYAPSSVINFDITITGSGGNTYPLATAVTRVFPYIKILDATKTNVIAEYSSGTGALKCNETAVAPSGNGTTFKMVLDADTLAPNTQYYLYIDPDLQNKQTTPIKFGKSIYFEFKTGAAVPSAPNWSSNAALTVSDVTGTGFNLSWPEASGAEAYKVIVSNTTGGVTINVLDTAISEGTACTVTGLTANRHYDIKVTATNIAGDSPASLSALAVTTPDKTLFTFVSGVPNSTSRYGFMPSGTVASETIFEKVYTYNDTLDSVNSRFFWYLQAGFNNTNARDHVDSFRLFNLTDNEEIDLDYGTTNFGLGTASWTASGITESDTGYTLISEMTSGDFKVAKIQPSSVWMRFELDIAEYLEAGKEYAITIDPQFHTGGANPTVLGKIYTFAFTTSTPDNQYPTWGSGAAITASDITGSGFTVSYPAANDNVGVVKYNIVLKQGSETVSSESITGLSKVFTGLDEATNYTVSVDAEDAAGNKSAVLNTGIRTLSVVPTWGTDAALTLSNVMATDVTINWPYSNTPEIVAGYALFVNGTEEERFRPTDYYCELGGLTSSTKYVFELKPFNKQGQFGEAISAMAVTDGAAVLNYTTTFVVEEIAGGEYYRNYLIKYPIDLTNFAMGWNFSNGIDTHLGNNLAGIRIYEKDTGTEIVLDKGTAPYAPDTDGALMAGDFRYTKSGGGDQGTGTETKIRLLLFKPSAATLAQFTPGKEYVLEMQPDFISNNGENTLSKITTFTFSIAPEDFEAPVWPAEAALEAVKIGPESIVIKWPAATDNFMLKEYQLQVNGGQSTVIDVQANPSYQLTGLSPDTEYALSLEAVDTKNNKSVPLVINVSTLLNDLTAPFWPVGSKLSVKNIAVDNANLSWTAADDNVEVTGYKVYNANVLLKETNALQLHITGLVPATTYVFRIEAVDQAGNMSSTGPISIIRTLEGKPDTNPPQWNGGGSHSYSTTADYSNAYVTINWPWATDNVAVREYQVYLEGELIATVSSIANSYSGTLPRDGSYHNYEVYACDASGNVSAQPQSFSILAGQLPDDLVAPYWPAGNEIIISDFTDKTAVISWSEAADNKGVVAYLLKRDQLWVV